MEVKVSIGLPVYNGEKYICETLDSILSQSFTDFELIISDNCSTDHTEEICKKIASKDKRVKYFKNNRNKGAAWNYNNVFNLSTGNYFKWAADDDLCAETFLEECVESLNNDKKAVLAFTHTPHIDLEGNIIGKIDFGQNVGSHLPVHIRFRNLICSEFGDDCRPVFGLIRSNILKETNLIGNYVGSDQTLLVELILRGYFIEIPKQLQFRRIYSSNSERCYRGKHRERAKWFDTKKLAPAVFPQWRLFFEFAKAVLPTDLPWSERLLCYKEILRWLRWGRAKMLKDDLIFSLRYFFNHTKK